jgi:hypothetical protein
MNRAFIHIWFALTIAGGLAQAQAPAPADAPKTAEQVFKNIQVLKGTPVDQPCSS